MGNGGIYLICFFLARYDEYFVQYMFQAKCVYIMRVFIVAHCSLLDNNQQLDLVVCCFYGRWTDILAVTLDGHR